MPYSNALMVARVKARGSTEPMTRKERVMKFLTPLTMILMLAAQQAAALSCLRPDPASAFQNAAAAEARYVVLLGQFDFDAPPEQPFSNDAQGQETVATFRGQGLGPTAFGPTPERSVTLRTSCAGPWCGNFPTPGQDVLAFVQQTDDGYLLTIGACGGAIFDPSTAPVVEACMRGEDCLPLDDRR